MRRISTHSIFTTTLLMLTPASMASDVLELSGEFVAEYSKVVSGGLRAQGEYRHLGVLNAEVDLEAGLGIKNTVLFAQYQHALREKGGTLDAGDIQAYSNLEVEASLDDLYEFWFETTAWDQQFRIKAGKIDANTEFNVVESAGNFSNSSAGFSPTIFVFPTYPNPATSLNLFFQLNKTINLAYGFYDGANAVDGIATGRRGPSSFFSNDKSDDYFHVLEISKQWGNSGKAHLGVWHHNGKFGDFSGDTKSGTSGFYLSLEDQLIGDTEAEGIWGFLQYGWADENLSEISQHFGAGIVVQGMGITRAADNAGIYITHVDLSDHQAAGFAENETSIELYYQFELAKHFKLKPNIQYIASPSGKPQLDDALVIGMRANLTF